MLKYVNCAFTKQPVKCGDGRDRKCIQKNTFIIFIGSREGAHHMRHKVKENIRRVT